MQSPMIRALDCRFVTGQLNEGTVARRETHEDVADRSRSTIRSRRFDRRRPFRPRFGRHCGLRFCRGCGLRFRRGCGLRFRRGCGLRFRGGCGLHFRRGRGLHFRRGRRLHFSRGSRLHFCRGCRLRSNQRCTRPRIANCFRERIQTGQLIDCNFKLLSWRMTSLPRQAPARPSIAPVFAQMELRSAARLAVRH
jgi:hypothetical protein